MVIFILYPINFIIFVIKTTSIVILILLIAVIFTFHPFPHPTTTSQLAIFKFLSMVNLSQVFTLSHRPQHKIRYFFHLTLIIIRFCQVIKSIKIVVILQLNKFCSESLHIPLLCNEFKGLLLTQ